VEFIAELSEINKIASQIILLKPEKVIIFKGEMGAGKTTFIQALCKELGVKSAMSSPTFSLVNEYLTANKEVIYHFDMYRIQKEEEALDMGIEEYLYSNNWCFIEWAEKIENLLPNNYSIIHISVLKNKKRNIKWEQMQ
jgi:tRNA threonylcarbamoyladenosine biosynthesis protein TsaE